MFAGYGLERPLYSAPAPGPTCTCWGFRIGVSRGSAHKIELRFRATLEPSRTFSAQIILVLLRRTDSAIECRRARSRFGCRVWNGEGLKGLRFGGTPMLRKA